MSNYSLDLSKDVNVLFKESIDCYNLNDFYKSKLILEYLNYIIPKNNNIINNLINCYKSLNTFSQIEDNFYNYVLNNNIDSNLLNSYVSAFFGKQDYLNNILNIYEKHGNEKQLNCFLLYLVSIRRYDLLSNLKHKLTDDILKRYLDLIPIKYVYESNEEIYEIRKNFIDLLDYCIDNNYSTESDILINPMMYFTSYQGISDVELYSKFNKLAINNSLKSLKNDYFNETNDKYNMNPIDQKLKKIHKSLNFRHGSLLDEIVEQRLCYKYLNENDKVLEIGGNIGRVSMIISKILNNQKNLIVLESNSEIFSKLHDNYLENQKNFYILNYALSKRELFQINWKTFTLEEKNQMSPEIQKEMEIVKYTDFNNIESKYNIQFNTLVLDCEGAFYYILKDDESILKNIKKIIIENDYSNFEQKSYVEKILKKYNFKVVESIDLDPIYYKFHPNSDMHKGFYQVFIKEENTQIISRKIKVGFVQPYYDTISHSISKVSNRLIKRLNTDQIQVYVIQTFSDFEKAKNLDLDVLVYITVGTDVFTNKSSFERIAPIQINFWGHINTSGKNTIDYYVSSKLYESTQEYFSEKLINFDSLGTYLVPDTEMKKAFISCFRDRSYFGLSEDSFVLFYPHAIFKILPDYDNLINTVLNKVPNAVIVFFIKKEYNSSLPLLLKRWQKSLKNNFSRVKIYCPCIFEDIPKLANNYIQKDGGDKSRFYYHNMIYLSDATLESFPFGAAITALDSFDWNKIMIGNPYVVRGKFTKGFYKKMNLNYLNPENDTEFEELVDKIGNNKSFRNQCEYDIENNKNKLYNDEDSVEEWKQFLVNAANLI